MQREMRTWARPLGLMLLAGAAAWTGVACSNGNRSGSGLFSGSSSGRERWTIRLARIESPSHAQVAASLAEQLKNVRGLNPSKVRVVSEAGSSALYYGEYEKIEGRDERRLPTLVFPPEYQRDIELIRSLSYQNQRPFFYAAPELLAGAAETPAPSGAPGDISTAKGTHALLIALFYNTADFDQRKEAAEAYVKDLRSRGFAAYYYHEALRSFVYVGDFDATDLVQTPDRRVVYGPRVERFVAGNPEEFKYLTENGMKMKHNIGGQMVANESLLLPLPGRSEQPNPSPREQRLPGEGY